MFVEHMLMTGTVVNMKNEIITAPLFLKFIVREKDKIKEEEEIRERRKKGRRERREGKRREEGVNEKLNNSQSKKELENFIRVNLRMITWETVFQKAFEDYSTH